jgi:hypothetical protein
VDHLLTGLDGQDAKIGLQGKMITHKSEDASNQSRIIVQW